MFVEHPFASMSVTVYVPAPTPVIVYEPPSFVISYPAGLSLFGPVQETSYGDVPPVAVIFMEPLNTPLHKGGTGAAFI